MYKITHEWIALLTGSAESDWEREAARYKKMGNANDVYATVCYDWRLGGLVKSGLHAIVCDTIAELVYGYHGYQSETVMEEFLYTKDIVKNMQEYFDYAELSKEDSERAHSVVSVISSMAPLKETPYGKVVEGITGLKVTEDSPSIDNLKKTMFACLSGNKAVNLIVVCTLFRRYIEQGVLVLKLNGNWVQFDLDTLLQCMEVKGLYTLTTMLTWPTRASKYNGIRLNIQALDKVTSPQYQTGDVPNEILWYHALYNVEKLLRALDRCRPVDSTLFEARFKTYKASPTVMVACAAAYKGCGALSTADYDIIIGKREGEPTITVCHRASHMTFTTDKNYEKWVVRISSDSLIESVREILSTYIDDSEKREMCLEEIKAVLPK